MRIPGLDITRCGTAKNAWDKIACIFSYCPRIHLCQRFDLLSVSSFVLENFAENYKILYIFKAKRKLFSDFITQKLFIINLAERYDFCYELFLLVFYWIRDTSLRGKDFSKNILFFSPLFGYN